MWMGGETRMTSEEIIKKASSNEKINGTLLDLQLYLLIKQILKMYFNKQISKEEANVYKLQAVKKYEEEKKQFEFEREMFQEHLQHIKTTETLRINLRKKMQNVESQKDINDCFDLAMQILNLVFKEEFM